MKIRKIKGTAILNGNVVDGLEENSTTNAPSQRAVNDGIKVLGKASKNLFNSRTAVSTSKITVLDNKNGVVELRGVSSYWNTLKVPIYLTKNTTYTIRSEYTKADDGAPLIDILDANNNAIRENYYATDTTLGGKFTTNSELNYIVFRCNGATNTGYVKYLNVQLEEGSTATEYEDYCEPSILVKDSNGYLHEVPYVTGKASKNLFNAYKYGENNTHTGNVSKYNIINHNKIEISYINGWSRLVLTVTGLEPDTVYTISAYLDKSNFNTSVASGFYDGSEYKDSGFTKGSGNVYLTFTSSSTGTFDMWFYGNWSGTNYSGSIVYQNIQIEKGSVPTLYERHFEPTLSIKDSNGVFQKVELNTPVILYSSKSGTFDSITLTEEVEHFKYVEVFGVGNTMICSVKIPMDLYNTGSLFTAGASYQYHCGVSLTGKSMTFVYNRRLNISSNAWDNGNYFKIYRIVGYR